MPLKTFSEDESRWPSPSLNTSDLWTTGKSSNPIQRATIQAAGKLNHPSVHTTRHRAKCTLKSGR